MNKLAVVTVAAAAAVHLKHLKYNYFGNETKKENFYIYDTFVKLLNNKMNTCRYAEHDSYF